MTEPCGFMFDSGNRCGAIATHVVHRGRWAGPEPNHAYTPAPLSRDDSIRAEATAAAEQRLAGLREAIEVAVDDWESRRVGVIPGGPTARLVSDLRVALRAPAPPPASPRQGEPVDVERLSIAMNRAYTYGTGTAEQVAAEYAALSEPAEAGEPDAE